MPKVTATEASRNFSDILSRVQYRDEEFEISRGKQTVAKLTRNPPEPKKIGEFLQWLSENRHLDDDDAVAFENLIDELRKETPQADPAWE